MALSRFDRVFSLINSVLDRLASDLVAAVGAFLSFVLAIAPPQPMLALGATETPRVTGLHETRAFVARLRLWPHDTRRSRAPDSVAFVTA